MHLTFAVPCAANDIVIPLTVHEALRKGVSGVARVQEPVSVGLPFPQGTLKEKKGVPLLAVKGAKEYQSRTLKKWPDGSVQWALVDFQTDVIANKSNKTISVVSGSDHENENTAMDYIALDGNDYISVSTGSMTVKISKKNYNLFESLTIDGNELISKKQKGIVLIDSNGDEYLASHDNNVNVTIEENGPVRAVIKVAGSHVRGDKKMLDYTVRMHFYKNKSRVRIIYTLKNASKERVETPLIKSLNFVSKLNLSDEINVEVKTHNGLLSDTLDMRNYSLQYYQAVSSFPQEYRGTSFFWSAPIPPDPRTAKRSWNKRTFKQEGYWIKKNDNIITRGEKNEYPDLAYIDVRNRNGIGVTAGIRFCAGWWPKSLRAHSDGTIEVGLWPQENEVGYLIRYGSHNTFEIMYDFHIERTNPAEAMMKFQYPLVAKATPEWYNRNVRGIYPLYHFVSFADESRYVKEMGWDYKVGYRNPGMKVWRYHYWGLGGFMNQHDFARIAIVNFLRDTENVARAGEYYLYAEARFNYNADWAVYHTDDYDYEKHQYSPKKNSKKAGMEGVVFGNEHMHWYGLPLYYYLTGDERIRESILDWAEVIRERARKHYVLVYQRFFGWTMYSLSALYEFTGDPTYLRIADTIFENLLSSKNHLKKKYWKSIYIDWNRGYVLRGKKLKPGLMTGYIIFDGLYNYYLHMDDDNLLREKVADVLEGLSDFMYNEPYFDGVKKSFRGETQAFWLPYIYDISDKAKSRHSYKLIQEAFYVNLAPYLSNGNPKWPKRMDKIIRTATWGLSGIWEGFGYIDHPGLQSMLFERMNPKEDNSPPPVITDFSAQLKGDKIVLHWTAPKDASRYQIKYANRKVVESLKFDPDKRIYEYDPEEFIAWWAGENIQGEPVPGNHGDREEFIIKRMLSGPYYFTIRSWDAGNNRSGISNNTEIYIN